MTQDSNQTDTANHWLSAGALDSASLEASASAVVSARIAEGKYKRTDVEYISRLNLPVVEGALNVSDRQLEKLRRLCQLADVDLVPARISSHRPYIGPVTVAAKKVLFSILKVLLKDTLRKQRDFNAAVISYLAAKTAKLDK